MEMIDIIHKRRSVRSFNGKPISDKDIQTILSAGMTTPSAMNKQPWRFVLISDNELKKEIAKISKYAQMILEAPLAILVCGDLDASFMDYWVIDCSASIQNILLSSCALGVGSVWTGISPDMRSDFSRLVNLPKNVVPHSLIVLGYSDAEFEKKDYFDKTKVHNNKW